MSSFSYAFLSCLGAVSVWGGGGGKSTVGNISLRRTYSCRYLTWSTFRFHLFKWTQSFVSCPFVDGIDRRNPNPWHTNFLSTFVSISRRPLVKWPPILISCVSKLYIYLFSSKWTPSSIRCLASWNSVVVLASLLSHGFFSHFLEMRPQYILP